jgi:phosphoserine phosphatase
MIDPLPSWRPGPTRSALVAFLDAVTDIPLPDRVAMFDVDGTLWCEKPEYVQLLFFVDGLQRAIAERPELAERPEYAAVLTGDQAALAELGLARVALALAETFAGLTPAGFDERVQAFFAGAQHPTLGRPLGTAVYQPMLELIAALRQRDVDVFLVTGGGTEFVRGISLATFGVAPERVVGTMIKYAYERRDEGPTLIRTAEVDGAANEGPAKVEALQRHTGRRPIFAAGNSLGDRELLEYALAGPGPTLALLVDHDDAQREMAYESTAGTIDDDVQIVELGRAEGWTIASMRDDWTTVFPSA